MAYQKTIWSPGDTISSAKLYNMENGITGLDTEVAEIMERVIELESIISRIELDPSGVVIKLNET